MNERNFDDRWKEAGAEPEELAALSSAFTASKDDTKSPRRLPSSVRVLAERGARVRRARRVRNSAVFVTASLAIGLLSFVWTRSIAPVEPELDVASVASEPETPIEAREVQQPEEAQAHLTERRSLREGTGVAHLAEGA